jgi:septal ring factor EnvC (AmiA/AmiB activator)
VVTATAAAALLAFGLIAPHNVASSAPKDDPRAEREQVRAEKARVAAQIDTNKASLAEVQDALNAIDENLRTQQAALDRTEAEVAQAEQDIEDAQAAITKLNGEVTALRAEIRRRAVQAFVNPPGNDALTVLGTEDYASASNRKFYIELRAQDDADVADRLQGAIADLAYQRKKAAAAKRTAEAKRAEQAKRTAAVQAARDEQAALASKIQSRIDSQIQRSIQLAATDRALSKRIAEEQARLQAQLLAAQAAQQAREREAAAAAAAAAARAPSTQAPDGSETTPLPPVSGSGSGTGTGGISLCTVNGITVNCAIESQLSAMISAARADGLNLTGGGYRDPSDQIRLRREHCGSSYYAIYQMSPGACHPPTARPGQSQHEIGLAIDFHNCSSRSTQCYQWLSAHASAYGFYNLPSEAWHWSTSGS